MKNKVVGLIAFVVIAGCSSNTPDSDTHAIVPLDSEHQDEKHRWANVLVGHTRSWPTVTAEPDLANRLNYGLCRIARPGVDDHGPHDASTFLGTGQHGPGASRRSPANHYLVSRVGRAYFYEQADSKGPIPITSGLPVGTTIVKEKYDDIKDARKRKNTKALGVMIKREPGYNAEHGDWQYGYIELDPAGKVSSVALGKLSSCIDCHGNRANTDYVFRSYPLIKKPD